MKQYWQSAYFWRRPVILLAFGLLLCLLLVRWEQTEALNEVMVDQSTSLSCDWSGQSYEDFYDPPPAANYSVQQVGEIVRAEHIMSYSKEEVGEVARLSGPSLYGAEAYRVLYVSRTEANKPIIVSGTIVVPTGEMPEEGYPLLIHAHPTTGVADQCAPSTREVDIKALLNWVAHGYMVTASDYPGLGTPGFYHYGIGKLSGYSVLDSGRAGLNFCDSKRNIGPETAANEIFLEGHSQGGQAALFAQELHNSYARSLDIKGSVLFAPAAEFKDLVEQTAEADWSIRVAPLTLAMYSLSDYYGTPATLDPWIQEEYAGLIPYMAEERCITGYSAWIGFQPANVFQPDLLEDVRAGDWEKLEPWATYLTDNTPGNFTSDIPMLILQGDRDALIDVSSTQHLTQRLCAQDNIVEFKRFRNAGHATVVSQGRPDALQWMSERMANKAVVNDCQIDTGPEPDRQEEPLIVRGSQIRALSGKSLSDLILYAYKGGVWRTVPFQIDEKNVAGQIVATEDGLLDDNDEVVFMAYDAGEKPPQDAFFDERLPGARDGRYEIGIVDPFSENQSGFVYLFEPDVAVSPNSTDYVDFNVNRLRVITDIYQLGLPADTTPIVDYLKLGSETTGVDILDRTKVRLDCALPAVCPITENDITGSPNDVVVKDGPVRVVLREGLLLAYNSLVSWSRPYAITDEYAGDVQVSVDFSPAITGATYFNAAVPQGVAIDGLPDDVPPTPASNWWQVSTTEGTVVQVTDIASIGGTPTNYYVDDDQIDKDDTGDQKHFGDTGLRIRNPNRGFVHHYNMYILPDRQANVGEKYVEYYANPLSAEATWLKKSSMSIQGYLPLMMK